MKRKEDQPMDCTEFQELLSDYENLNETKKKQLEEHSKECSSCAEELEQYLSMLQALKSLPKLTAPENFLAELNSRIDKENIKQQTRTNLLSGMKKYSYRYGTIAACLALIAVIGVNNPELIDKMNSKDDGVISVVTTTVAPSGKPVGTSVPVVQSAELLPAVQITQAPIATIQPATKASEPKTTKAPVVATKKPTATKTPTTKAPVATAIPQRNNKSLATPIPQPVRANISPTAVPDVSIGAEDTLQVNSYDVTYGIGDKPETKENVVVTQEPIDNSGIAVASMMEDEPSSVVLNPDEYQLPENLNARTIDNSNDVNGYTASSNSIEVSYASADKAKEIIDEYSISNDGEYYSVSSDKMEEFLQAMSEAGIEYADNCIEDGADTVTFRLIIS